MTQRETIRTRRFTIGAFPGAILAHVWIARGRHDNWPGLLFGGTAIRTVPKRYAHRALRLFVEQTEQVEAGSTPEALPGGYFGLRRLLRQRRDIA